MPTLPKTPHPAPRPPYTRSFCAICIPPGDDSCSGTPCITKQLNQKLPITQQGSEALCILCVWERDNETDWMTQISLAFQFFMAKSKESVVSLARHWFGLYLFLCLVSCDSRSSSGLVINAALLGDVRQLHSISSVTGSVPNVFLSYKLRSLQICKLLHSSPLLSALIIFSLH